MAAPTSMTRHTLNALKGWPHMAAVDFTTEYDPTITTVVPSGTVVHVNADGRYVRGVGTEPVMPLFMFSGSTDTDVSNDGGDAATERGVWIGTVSGQAMSLVAIGAYELTSTEFIEGTFAPNAPLTSPLTGPDAGKLTVGTTYTDMIVGIVSRGVVDNGYGTEAIAFWPFPIFPR